MSKILKERQILSLASFLNNFYPQRKFIRQFRLEHINNEVDNIIIIAENISSSISSKQNRLHLNLPKMIFLELVKVISRKPSQSLYINIFPIKIKRSQLKTHFLVVL